MAGASRAAADGRPWAPAGALGWVAARINYNTMFTEGVGSVRQGLGRSGRREGSEEAREGEVWVRVRGGKLCGLRATGNSPKYLLGNRTRVHRLEGGDASGLLPPVKLGFT